MVQKLNSLKARPRRLECAGFYKNRIGGAIVEALQQRGSVMENEDLAAHRTRFNDPISTTYRGHTVYEIRPPTQASPPSCASVLTALHTFCLLLQKGS